MSPGATPSVGSTLEVTVRQIARGCRVIALVGHAHHAVTRADLEEDLGGAGQQRDDARPRGS